MTNFQYKYGLYLIPPQCLLSDKTSDGTIQHHVIYAPCVVWVIHPVAPGKMG